MKGKIYKYDIESGTYLESIPYGYSGCRIKSLDEILITTEVVTEMNGGKEVITTVPLQAPTFPDGITDVKPVGSIYIGISPKFDIDNNVWVEDTEAVAKYKSEQNLIVKQATDIEILGQMVSDLILESAKKDETIKLMGQQITSLVIGEII